MTNSITSFIDGKLLDPTGASGHSVYNPAMGAVSAEVHFASATDIDTALNSAANAFHTWAGQTPIARSRVLFRFKTLLEQHSEEISALLTAEHGKVLDDARGEVQRALELIEHCCGMPRLLQGQYSSQVGTHVDCYTLRQPLGVCVGITPFNFPVMISAWMCIPAIACGNTFILKPSEKTPSTVIRFAELLSEAGLPAGVLNVVQGDKTAVNQLITDRRVSAVSCVGSTAVAEYIYKTAISHGKRAQAFGGAKNHALVMADADIDDTVNALLGAAYGAAGERCMAISVAMAEDRIADDLIAALKERIPNLAINSGLVENTDMGPLISAEHRDRVISYIELGLQEGAELVVDGRNLNMDTLAPGFFLGATLFDRVTPKMRIYQEEIFGPVLCVMRVNDYQSAVNYINQHEYGNGVAIFTQNGGIARAFAHEVQVGMVGINVPIPVPVAYHSFGGWKRSIFGDSALHGDESMRFYTRAKSVTTRWPKSTLQAHFHMPVSG